jgi:hypothetical protein
MPSEAIQQTKETNSIHLERGYHAVFANGNEILLYDRTGKFTEKIELNAKVRKPNETLKTLLESMAHKQGYTISPAPEPNSEPNVFYIE